MSDLIKVPSQNLREFAPRGASETAPYAIVGGTTPRITATMSIPADNNALAAGDAISNSATGSAVVPIEFTMPRTSGRITGCRGVVTPASSNLVITNLDFDLLLFRPETNIPFAAGSYIAHNSAMAISAAAMRQLVGVIRFNSSSWRSPAGSTSVAGVAGYQRGALLSSAPYFPWNISDAAASTTIIRAVVQAQAAWNAANVINQFDFALDVDVD